jgi:hypothetical protein
MATMTFYVALAFMRSEDGEIVACEPKEARSGNRDSTKDLAALVGSRAILRAAHSRSCQTPR